MSGPPEMLFDEKRNGAGQNRLVFGMLDVQLDHLGQQRGLRAIQVVDTSSVGNKPVNPDEIQEVLNHVLGNLDI